MADSWVKIIDHSAEYERKLHEHCYKQVSKACILLSGRVKERLRTKAGPCNDGHGGSPEEMNRSKPGESPHLQCGTLSNSITWEVDKTTLEGRVGSNLPYSKYLTEGTSHMRPRPFLEPALEENRQRIVEILTEPMK